MGERMPDSYNSGDLKAGGSAPPIEPGNVLTSYDRYIPGSNNYILMGLKDPNYTGNIPKYEYAVFTIKQLTNDLYNEMTYTFFIGSQNSESNSFHGFALQNNTNRTAILPDKRKIITVFGKDYNLVRYNGNLNYRFVSAGDSTSYNSIFSYYIDRSEGSENIKFKIWLNGFLICDESNYGSGTALPINFPNDLNGYYPFLMQFKTTSTQTQYFSCLWIWYGDTLPTENDITSTAFARRFFNHETLLTVVPDVALRPKYLHKDLDFALNNSSGKKLEIVGGSITSRERIGGIKLGLHESNIGLLVTAPYDYNNITWNTIRQKSEYITQIANPPTKQLIACFGMIRGVIAGPSDASQIFLSLPFASAKSITTHFFLNQNPNFRHEVNYFSNTEKKSISLVGSALNLENSNHMTVRRVFTLIYRLPNNAVYLFQETNNLSSPIRKRSLFQVSGSTDNSFYLQRRGIPSSGIPRCKQIMPSKVWIFNNEQIDSRNDLPWDEPEKMWDYFLRPDSFNSIAENYSGSRALGIAPAVFYDAGLQISCFNFTSDNMEVIKDFNPTQYVYQVDASSPETNFLADECPMVVTQFRA
jgi:hypothetical protein